MKYGDTCGDTYICIDLKSFYASVECVARGLDPLTANLVVADASRTDKTICLAVSPNLKAKGIPGRPRLFEVKQIIQELRERTGEEISYIAATPRMAKYIAVSSDIYSIYLKYVAPEDMHVYSVDEVFIDAGKYLALYHMTAHQLAVTMVRDVLSQTGITATAGIGTNMYLAKIAMDIVAKKQPADADGVRVAELDEMSYREQLWDHLPLTDFWQIGNGTVRRLSSAGLRTMGDIARCSLGGRSDFYNEDTLFRLFGVNAELLIDHAWGLEPCTMWDIKHYQASSKSVGIGQVLPRSYTYEELSVIVKEMTEQLVYDLLKKELLTDAVVLHIGYDRENVHAQFQGETKLDHYGRRIPKSAHGTASLGTHTDSLASIMRGMMDLFDHITDSRMTARRVTVTAIHVRPSYDVPEQMDLFTDGHAAAREKSLQTAILGLQQRYGKNVILKGHDYQEGATTRERNAQIGGHRA